MPESERPQYTWMSRFIRCIYGIFLLMFIVQGIVGCMYINYCPAEPSLPFFMVSCGLIPVFWALSWCKNGCRILCYCLISLIYIIWFFIGTLLVYMNYYSTNKTEKDQYCDKTFYLFAFWCSNLTYMLTVVYLSCFFSACCNDRMEPFVIYNDEDQPLLWS